MARKKKVLEPVIPPNVLYVEYTRHVTGGGPIPGDDWDHEDEFVDFTINRVVSKKDDAAWLRDQVVVDFSPQKGQTVWTVVVRYTTGCTFGTIFHEGTIVAVVDNQKKAETLRKEIENDTYLGLKPWNGYFEKFEDVEICAFTVD